MVKSFRLLRLRSDGLGKRAENLCELGLHARLPLGRQAGNVETVGAGEGHAARSQNRFSNCQNSNSRIPLNSTIACGRPMLTGVELTTGPFAYCNCSR